ncbi:MAG: IS3 family transposase [Thermoanaerobaculia bacterium]|nr:IS3 family transposase [Thermoanaerobaculia bacterium]
MDEHHGEHGVESICRQLPIASSTYYERKACQRDPSRHSARAQQDERLKPEIARVYRENYDAYGPRKVWRQLGREDILVARCTVECLLRAMELRGVVRSRRYKVTTSDPVPENWTTILRNSHHPKEVQNAQVAGHTEKQIVVVLKRAGRGRPPGPEIGAKGRHQ